MPSRPSSVPDRAQLAPIDRRTLAAAGSRLDNRPGERGSAVSRNHRKSTGTTNVNDPKMNGRARGDRPRASGSLQKLMLEERWTTRHR